MSTNDSFRLEYAENSGAFLSLGTGLSPWARTALFVVGTGIVLLVCVIAAIRHRWPPFPLLGLSLVFAGGISNLVDRITRGVVIDFMNVGVGALRTGIFNVADMAIMLGVALLVFSRRQRVDPRRGRSLLGLVPLGMLLGAPFTAEAAPPPSVGYRGIHVQDAATGELFPVALWYPTRAAPAPFFLTGSLSACRLPVMLCRLVAFEMPVASNASPADGKFGLIVISHGAGGLSLNHRDLAMALASHGYVVAAPTHPRGKDNDISGVGVWVGRPKQVSRVIDAVLEDAALGSHIRRERIGVVGHSNGGYTALAVAGATPTPVIIGAHCRQHPDDSKFCSYGGAAARDATRRVGDIPDVRDDRVRAIVLMAPNAAPFTDDALARVAVPIRLYGAERDDLTLVRYHAERLAKALPRQTEYVLVAGAGHYSFVASFPGALKLVAGEAARDPQGFDRDAMHGVMNREIVDFFDRKLAPRSGRAIE